jgi:hypothetical protein
MSRRVNVVAGRRAVVAGLLAVLLLGCGGSTVLRMYEGPALPASEIAELDVSHRSIALMGVDTLQHRYQALAHRQIELLPGPHVLLVNYSSLKGRSSRPVSLEFNAQAGRKYVLKAVGGYARWSAWIEDAADGTVVGGHRPDW